MRSGRLRHRVDIEHVTQGQDGFGAVTETWAVLHSNVPASIEPLSGRDLFSAQQINPEISMRIRIRYVAAVTSKMRIKFGSRVFEIVSPPINFEERNRELLILVKERV